MIAELVTPELAERFPLLRQPALPAKGGPATAGLMLDPEKGFALFHPNLQGICYQFSQLFGWSSLI